MQTLFSRNKAMDKVRVRRTQSGRPILQQWNSYSIPPQLSPQARFRGIGFGRINIKLDQFL